MPIAKVQLEDGRIARFEVPEGTTQEQVLQFAQEMNAQSPVSAQNSPLQGIEQELNQGISPMDRRRQIITELSRVQSSGDMSVIKPLIDELSSISENTGGGIEQVGADRGGGVDAEQQDQQRRHQRAAADAGHPVKVRSREVQCAANGAGQCIFEVEPQP